MAKFVVAFRDRDTAAKIASLLIESGYDVIRVCTLGDEVKRIFKSGQDGILISGYRLKDRFIDQVIEDIDGNVEILCLAKTENIAKIESNRIFRMQFPITRTKLDAWADMMSQLHYQKIPQRSTDEKIQIQHAKRQLMEEKNMSEPEAHRFLQNLSMKTGLRMAKVAEIVIRHEHFLE